MSTPLSSADLDTLCINTIRLLAIDGVQKANSGHPGLPMGAAPMAYTLWQNVLRHDPSRPEWPDRDRFVLSAGHGSMLLYALMHVAGFADVSRADLQNFRQWHSRTPGHPENFVTRGVDATTGPLGQGAGNAIGMAMAERFLAAHFNRPGLELVDHRTYALVSDGDLMEGVAAEAASLAGHLRLGKLTFLYDANAISLDGPTSLCFTEDVGKRFEAYGWQVLSVADGDRDVAAIGAALQAAEQDSLRPTLIVVHTTIGFGSPNKAGKSAAHGNPLGVEEIKLVKKAFGFDPEAHFVVPEAAQAHFDVASQRGKTRCDAWHKTFATYKEKFPELAATWERAHKDELPPGWKDKLPVFTPGTMMATREAGGQVVNALAAALPAFAGGDADLSCSTLTGLKGSAGFDGQSNASGRNIHFGVREHGMGAIANGIAFHKGMRAFVSTFFVFSDYMRPAVRLAALCKLPVTYIWTHDSIGLGEDGPTHQPIEHLASLRAMPNLHVMRPADATETACCWQAAMEQAHGPTALVLGRQKLSNFDYKALGCTDVAAGVARGAYVLADAPGGQPQAILMATGSEVHIALAAQRLLQARGIRSRVVSMPCWELFAAQDAGYKEQVLPKAIGARLSIEAASTFGWARYVGDQGESLGIDHFGHSAPAEEIYEKFGLTPQHAADMLQKLVKA
jgi:transketolase